MSIIFWHVSVLLIHWKKKKEGAQCFSHIIAETQSTIFVKNILLIDKACDMKGQDMQMDRQCWGLKYWCVIPKKRGMQVLIQFLNPSVSEIICMLYGNTQTKISPLIFTRYLKSIILLHVTNIAIWTWKEYGCVVLSLKSPSLERLKQRLLFCCGVIVERLLGFVSLRT